MNTLANADYYGRCGVVIKKYKDRFTFENPGAFRISIKEAIDGGMSVFHVHIHLIPRYKGDVENPKGGVRGVIPHKQKY